MIRRIRCTLLHRNKGVRLLAVMYDGSLSVQCKCCDRVYEIPFRGAKQ